MNNDKYIELNIPSLIWIINGSGEQKFGLYFDFEFYYFQNVIQQMLAVQPDLLNDQVIPPASQSTIDNLPTVTLNQEHIGRSSLPIN